MKFTMCNARSYFVYWFFNVFDDVVIWRFNHILQLASSSGEHEKILQGIFENYLESKVKDSRMQLVRVRFESLE